MRIKSPKRCFDLIDNYFIVNMMYDVNIFKKSKFFGILSWGYFSENTCLLTLSPNYITINNIVSFLTKHLDNIIRN